MKKIIILLILMTTVLAVHSCRDAYEIVQDGEFSESATFQNVNDMQKFLNNTYDRVDVSNEIAFTAIFTDELGIGSQNGGQNVSLYNFVLNSGDAFASAMWLAHYRAINSANRLIEGAKLVTPTTTAEQQSYNSILAQAQAIRAFAHFQLLCYFAPTIKDNNSAGVILLTKVPQANEKLPRNTVGEVFASIESDLNSAYANIDPVKLPSTTSPAYKFVSKGFIDALRARMYLYRGDYTKAEQYADTVINTSGLVLSSAGTVLTDANGVANAAFYGSYTTPSTSPYKSMLQDFTRGEVIMALDRPAGKGAIAGQFYFNRTNLTGGPYMDLSRGIYNLININGDVRKHAYVDATAKIDPNYQSYPWGQYLLNDVLCIDKYSGKNLAELNSDLKLFRLSEMYFIKAECRVAANDLAGAALRIKAVRDARNYIAPVALPVYTSTAMALKDILTERRVELALEGHRYLDLKRIGASAGITTTERNPKDVEGYTNKEINITDYRFTLPIPSDEINANPIQQNPGY
ncbi:RagB/SusD family nutrient uptake outer membrane protein [Chryseobacterium sp.]|uniref:RagB/SusD family nutrient uptake outer membrane protein n=1 Tax=Chryseobacterium sp. TaxID=1871047 RepID=UPI000ECE0E31|nr:RagB/SusD family nutrient uptake outer membrane protein [Chryseobacterium sp.]HCA05927.1 RagB/SusD family nutrient uptake outer membrane protein [Chryseobacterium sp.]